MIGITETGGPTGLTFGAIPDTTLLQRVGATVVGLALTALVPSSRLINTTAPLAGGGDLSADLTLTVAAVSNTSSGVAPVHAGAADVGKALIATATAAAWGTDFGTRTLTTTGDYISNVGTGSIRLGLAAGSGAGVQSAASAGNIRGARGSSATGFSLMLRNNGDTGDLFGLQWDSTFGIWAIGQSSAGGNTTLQLNCITSVSIRRTGGTVMATFSSTGLSLTSLAGAAFSFNANTLVNAEVKFEGAGAAAGLSLTMRGQPGTTTGGATNMIGGAATAAASTGGAVLMQTGDGGAGGAGGMGTLAAGVTGTAVDRFRFNDTGVGLYTTAPVAQAARVNQLTDSTTGTPATTLVDVTTLGVADPAKCNDNFASVLTKINAIELAIHNIGLTA